MAANYNSKNNQDNFDIVLQWFGDLEQTWKFLRDNDLNINDKVQIGSELIINNENLGDLQSKDFYQKRNFIVMNADLDDITTTTGDFNNDFNNDYLNT